MYPRGMCCPKPSATSTNPISNKNDSASIFTVGCRSINPETGVINQTITATASSTAALITGIAGQGTVVNGIGGDWNLCGTTMPTAVITEAIENARSRSRICPIVLEILAGTFALAPA